MNRTPGHLQHLDSAREGVPLLGQVPWENLPELPIYNRITQRSHQTINRNIASSAANGGQAVASNLVLIAAYA